MTSAPPIRQMLFSTRGRDPEGGADSVREVIARSPEVPERAYQEFAARADLGGSLLHAELDEPVFTFSPVGDGTWLLCRATSLGRYRKGAHQFLVHGLVLAPEHLAWLDGNPLLLDRPEIAGAAGVGWIETHPGANAELPPIAMDPEVSRRAPAENRRRLDLLALSEAAADAAFPAALGAIARGERVACLTDRPRASWVEWILLHLHTLDRPTVSFHSWYSHGRPLSYRLLVTTPREAPRVRGQFRGLRLVDLGTAAGDPVGDAARRLRATSGEALLSALAAFHLTRLVEQPLPSLGEADALLALRDAAGERLTSEERARADLLRRRSEPAGRLRYAVADLAAAWQSGEAGTSPAGDFAAAVRRMAAAIEVDPAAVDAVAGPIGRLPAGSSADRWALLALLAAKAHDRPQLAQRRVPAWRAVVPRGGLGELLAAVDARAAEAVPVLDGYVVQAAEADTRDGGRETPDWPAYLAWRAGHGAGLGPVAERIETLAGELPPETGAAWMRRLGEVYDAAGRPAEALRVWVDGEAPRRSAEERQGRVDGVVGWALDHRVEGVAERLDHPALGDAVAKATAAWATGRDPAVAWDELSARIRSWRPEAIEATGAGALVARLATSPLAGRLSEIVRLLDDRTGRTRSSAPRVLAEAAERLAADAESAVRLDKIRALVAGAAELLRARGQGSGTSAADRSLLRLALAAVVLDAAAPGSGDAARLRAAWTSYLAELVRHRRTDAADGPLVDDWMDLLTDDLRRHPPLGADDPRLGFYLHLAWRRWAEERTTVARLRLRRALDLRPPGAVDEWHREILAGIVPAARRIEAARIAGWAGHATAEPPRGGAAA